MRLNRLKLLAGIMILTINLLLFYVYFAKQAKFSFEFILSLLRS